MQPNVTVRPWEKYHVEPVINLLHWIAERLRKTHRVLHMPDVGDARLRPPKLLLAVGLVNPLIKLLPIWPIHRIRRLTTESTK
jgi:hypothetical protein